MAHALSALTLTPLSVLRHFETSCRLDIGEFLATELNCSSMQHNALNPNKFICFPTLAGWARHLDAAGVCACQPRHAASGQRTQPVHVGAAAAAHAAAAAAWSNEPRGCALRGACCSCSGGGSGACCDHAALMEGLGDKDLGTCILGTLSRLCECHVPNSKMQNGVLDVEWQGGRQTE